MDGYRIALAWLLRVFGALLFVNAIYLGTDGYILLPPGSSAFDGLLVRADALLPALAQALLCLGAAEVMALLRPTNAQ